jgi:hypothetical protein
MAEFLDYDPRTGISHYFDYNEETGDAQITTVQDVEAVAEYAKTMANDESNFTRGVKKGWWLYAKIPAIVELKMRAKGIDLKDPTATKRIIQEINEHYPAFKCTHKNHGGLAPKLFVPGVSRAE